MPGTALVAPDVLIRTPSGVVARGRFTAALFACGGLCLLVAAGLPAPAAASERAPRGSDPGILEEIIVTARKVRENVLDVPLSVQVISGERLDEIDLSVLFDLQHEIPGLVVNSVGMHGAGFALRGVADQGGTSASVAIHLDGVYLGNSRLAIHRLFDLERIEVLKGPQGTLYGRNSTGGTLNFITRSPGREAGGSLEGALGSFDTVRLQGHVNAPLGETLALRIAFIGSSGDGFIRNTVDARRFAEQDYWGLRAALRFEPEGGWRTDLVAQRSYDDGASAELWLPNPQFLPDPNDIHLTTVTLADPFLRIATDNLSLTVEHDWEALRLRSISGYAEGQLDNLDDCAGLPILLGCARGADPARDRQWSQEFQLASAGDLRVDWLVGGFWFSGESAGRFFQLLPRLNPRPLNDQFSTSDERVWALFGQAGWQLDERWGLTAGLRYSHEAIGISNIGTGVRDNAQLVVLDDTWDKLSWRLDLEYAPRDHLLVYAGLATGFKSGGMTTTRLPEGHFNRFAPEDLLAFETGVKGQWPARGLALNAALFHYDFSDLQTNSVYLFQDRVIAEVENATGARVHGLDLAGSLQLTAGLELAGGVIWLPRREFVDFTSTRTTEDLAGNVLSRAPEWSSVVSLTWRWPLAGRGEFSARLDHHYRSRFYYTKENRESESQGAHGLLNLLLRYESARGDWYAFASGRNLTDEAYFHQVFIQSTPGYPDTWELGMGVRF